MTEDITVVYCFVAGDSSLRPSLSPVLSKSSVSVAVTSNGILTAPPTPVSTTPVTSLTPRTSPHPASHVPSSSSSSHHGSYYLPHPRPLTPHNATTHSPHPHHHPSHHIPSSGECPVKFVHVARLRAYSHQAKVGVKSKKTKDEVKKGKE